MEKKKPLPPPPPELGVLMLDVEQVAAALNMGRSTVWKYVKDVPGFPQPHRITPRTLRWKASEIKTWVDQLTQTNAPQIQAAG